MLGADAPMAERAGLISGETDRAARPIGELGFGRSAGKVAEYRVLGPSQAHSHPWTNESDGQANDPDHGDRRLEGARVVHHRSIDGQRQDLIPHWACVVSLTELPDFSTFG